MNYYKKIKLKHLKSKNLRNKTDLSKELKKQKIFDKSRLNCNEERKIWKRNKRKC